MLTARKPIRAALTCLTVLACASTTTAQASTVGGSCPAAAGSNAAVEWGINGVEQLGAGFRDNRENGPRGVIGLTNIREVKAGFKFALAVLDNCTVESWGANTKAQLGNAKRANSQPHPGPVLNLSAVKEVAAGNAHAMALLYNGTVWTWGASEFGERGNGEKGWEREARLEEPEVAKPRDEPAEVPGLQNVVQIASAGTDDYALLASGEVLAWGENAEGVLGIEQAAGEQEACYGETHARIPVPCSTVPRRVQMQGHRLTGVERIAAGAEDGYAVRGAGRELVSWGANKAGQLGDATTERSANAVPVRFRAPAPIAEVAAGLHHVLARLQNGLVYAWGSDGSGELGIKPGAGQLEECPQTMCSTIPVLVSSLTNVSSVAAGEGNSLIVKQEQGADKVAYAFGSNGGDEVLGLEESLTGTATPRPLTGLPSVGGVALSSTNGIALLEASSTPAPVASLVPRPRGIEVNWKLPGEEFKIRYRPVGTKPWSKFQIHGGSCEAGCRLALQGLAPEPYEVALVAFSRELKKPRYLTGTPLPAPGAPVGTSTPIISGLSQQGQQLTASAGTWTNSPTAISYQWMRCEGFGEEGSEEELGTECVPIEGATSAALRLTSADVTYSVEVRVVASNPAGWSVATSATPEVVLAAGEESLPPAPIELSAPVIAGAGAVGSRLTAIHGGWEHEPIGYAYKWLRCRGVTLEGAGATCAAIAGATSASYTVKSADSDDFVEVQEIARDPGGYNTALSRPVRIP